MFSSTFRALSTSAKKMSLKKLAIDQIELANKRVVARVDFNVPLKNGVISNTQRIDAAIPTIKHALEKGAKARKRSFQADARVLHAGIAR